MMETSDHTATSEDPFLARKRISGTTTKRSTAGHLRLDDESGSQSNASLRTKRKRKAAASATTNCIKYGALFLLVGQMVGLVLLMRYTRTQQGQMYLASTAVFFMELLKLVICVIIAVYQIGWKESWRQSLVPVELLKLCVPSFLYTIQNNLLYLALSHLDAATYQVCYQLKILTTAIFSVVLLQRRFSAQKWLSLVLLMVGVIVVQFQSSSDTDSDHHHPEDALPQHKNGLDAADTTTHTSERFIGFVAVLCAACTSGFSGVYFEKILKGSTTSLWIRNVQMGLPSVLVAFATVLLKDGASVRTQGLLQGYNGTVWTVIWVQALGGLIVATVVKYADNVLKVFAASFSIVLSSVISAILFDFHPTSSFVMGASLVILATILYAAPEKKRRKKTILPLTSASRKR
ncbi:solute carrier family 35 (UDP-sugar transporter), member A1/2/3 [Fistulifera solaris]|uniref:Solute carrier family 35 (UDP-sugar transporter), member A1/2/3 n=1 Tax=Fistulifera solaris TaxID=1519565 RepID=A0A1Z5KPD6_FISSO|nr:solute carrier family 35 (UDP-sugar transporter), member A1/2/3 [Fistulifera solaris]|eukprot:GAX28156.1 solute carrier family 35 (UDP-sugar transporter), member A1/2/3 [Fistulifera solaris]